LKFLLTRLIAFFSHILPTQELCCNFRAPVIFQTYMFKYDSVHDCNNPNWIVDEEVADLADHVGKRQNLNVVGGEAEVSVLKPGSDTMCKALY
jgi:hypothetical protein